LVLHDRIGEVGPLLLAAEKQIDEEVDVFGAALENLVGVDENLKAANKLVASEPSRTL
jgi:hypothetical protein